MYRRAGIAAIVGLLSCLSLSVEADPGACNPIDFRNDHRISDMGGLGTPNIHVADDPAVAYNSTDKEFLVVWTGTENDSATEQTQIYGQRIDAVRGGEIGGDLLLGTTPGVVDSDRDARQPAVAYNSAENEYLVIWVGEEDVGAPTETEVYGQRVSNLGVTIDPAFRISDCGVDGDAAADVGVTFGHPIDVSYNATDNRYLCVWRCDDVGDGGIVNGEFEIHGRLVNGNGSLFGAEDFQISEVGGSNGVDTEYDAESPKCAWNSTNNEYLVVWGADNSDLGDGDREIFGQLLSNTGAQIGLNDFQISSTVHSDSRDSAVAGVVYAPGANEYLVVWAGDIVTNDLSNIFGQFVTNAGVLSGSNFAISQNGTLAGPASEPTIVFNSVDIEFLVTWQAQSGADENEIFGQRVSAAGLEIGLGDLRISDLGPDGNGSFDAGSTGGLAYAGAGLNSYYAVFNGQDNRDSQVQAENEIFGQFVDPVLEIERTLLTSGDGVDAIDTVEYEIVVRHAAVVEGADTHLLGLRDALNLQITDDLAALTGINLVSAEIDDGAIQTDVSASFGIDAAGNLETTGDVDLLLFTNDSNHEELTIVIRGTVSNGVGPGDTIDNGVCLTWENYNPGLVRDGYCDSDDADTITVPAFLRVTKSLTGAATALPTQTITYQIDTEVIEGTTTGLQFVDTIPLGLTYVGGSAVVSDANGMTINGFTDNGGPIGQLLTLDCASVENPGDVDLASTVDTDVFVITYEVTADFGSAELAQPLSNDLDATADGGLSDSNNTAGVTVLKDDTSTVIISASPDPSNAGNPVTVTYAVTANTIGLTPAGIVEVTDGVDSCMGTVASSDCILNLTTQGSRTITATYMGDANFDGSSDDTMVTVNPGQVDVSDRVSIRYQRAAFNRRTGELRMNVIMTNTSAGAIEPPLSLVLTSISSPMVTLTNADGTTTPDGKPFIDLSGLVGADNVLSPGESTGPALLIFNNPSRGRFTFDTAVLAAVMAAP